MNRTLAEVLMTHWILKGRQTVKKLLNECLVCRQFSAKKLMAPNIAPLPRMRAMQTQPFQHTGLDFAGPLMVKDGNQQSKAYVTLFTCATTGAVHLELAPDMSAGTFRQSLEKLVARREMPNLIVSGNAATFKSTAVELKELFDHPEVQAYLQGNYLTWKFNLSLALWWGGFYERMVGMTKGILRKALGNSKLTFRELEVILIKADSILNNRPLTYQSEELDEQALTPIISFMETSWPPCLQFLKTASQMISLGRGNYMWKRNLTMCGRDGHLSTLPLSGNSTRSRTKRLAVHMFLAKVIWYLSDSQTRIMGSERLVR